MKERTKDIAAFLASIFIIAVISWIAGALFEREDSNHDTEYARQDASNARIDAEVLRAVAKDLQSQLDAVRVELAACQNKQEKNP